jgi:hypothetical protein
MKSIFVEKRHFELNAGVIWEMMNLFLRSPKQKRCRELVAELYRIEKKFFVQRFSFFSAPVSAEKLTEGSNASIEVHHLNLA